MKLNNLLENSQLAELLADAGLTLDAIKNSLIRIHGLTKPTASRIIKEPYTHGILYAYLSNNEELKTIEDVSDYLADLIENSKIDYTFEYAQTEYITRTSPFYSDSKRKNAIKYKLATHLYPNLSPNNGVRKMNEYGDVTKIKLAGNRTGKRI